MNQKCSSKSSRCFEKGLAHRKQKEVGKMREKEIEVVSPLGAESVTKESIVPRHETLEEKTVCEVWNGDFKGDFTFPAYRDLLKERYPGVKVIPFTDFPFSSIRGTPAHQRALDQKIVALAKERGCDALISGNGG